MVMVFYVLFFCNCYQELNIILNNKKKKKQTSCKYKNILYNKQKKNRKIYEATTDDGIFALGI